MEKQLIIENHLKFSLSKKAVISFVFSKLTFLIFGIIITASLFYVLSVQKNIQDINQLARIGEAIANIVSAVYSSPFWIEVEYKPNFSGTIEINNNFFVIGSNGKNLRFNVDYPIKESNKFEFDSCVKIAKSDRIVISPCQ